jgi:hypothetical protein
MYGGNGGGIWKILGALLGANGGKMKSVVFEPEVSGGKKRICGCGGVISWS